MATAATISARLILDKSDYDKNLDKADKQASDFANKMRGIGSKLSGVWDGFASIGGTLVKGALVGASVGILAVGGAMTSVIADSMEMNKFLELSRLQFTTLMGDADAASAHVEELFKIAATTPFEASEVINASKTLLTFGGAALDTKDNLLMVGDAAAAVGQPLDQVSFWFGRAYSAIQSGKSFGEAGARLQEMGILTADARAELEKLQESGASSTDVWALFTEKMGKYSGAMELQANTWEGLMATIKDNARLTIAKAMTPLFDLFKKGIKWIADFTSSETFTNWVDKLGGFVEKAVKQLEVIFAVFQNGGGLETFFGVFEDGTSYLGGFFGLIAELFGGNTDVAEQWGNKVSLAILWVLQTFKKIVTAFQTDKGLIVAVFAVLGTFIAAWAINTIIAMAPIILTIALIAGAAYLLYTAWTQNWGGIQEKTAALWAWLQPILQSIGNWLSVNIPLAIQAMIDWWNEISPVIEEAWNTISGLVEDGMNFISDLTSGRLGEWSAVWMRTVNAVKTIFNLWVANVKLVYQAFLALLHGDTKKFGELLGQVWRNAFSILKTFVSTGLANVKSVFKEGVNGILDWWHSVDWADLGASALRAIAYGLVNLLPYLLGKLGDVAKSIWNFLSGFFDGLGGGGGGGSSGGGGGGGGAGSNGRALGGPVYAGQPYVVGEVGREIFVPDTNGTIIPNNQLGKLGGGTVNYYNPVITIITGKPNQKASMKGLT